MIRSVLVPLGAMTLLASSAGTATAAGAGAARLVALAPVPIVCTLQRGMRPRHGAPTQNARVVVTNTSPRGLAAGATIDWDVVMTDGTHRTGSGTVAQALPVTYAANVGAIAGPSASCTATVRAAAGR